MRINNLLAVIIIVFLAACSSQPGSGGVGNSGSKTVSVTTNTYNSGNTIFEVVNTTNLLGYSWSYFTNFDTSNSMIISNWTVSNGFSTNLWQCVTNETISNTTVTNLYKGLIGSYTNTDINFISITNDAYFTNYFTCTNCGCFYTISFQFQTFTNWGQTNYLGGSGLFITNGIFITNFVLSNYSEKITNIQNTNILTNNIFEMTLWNSTNINTQLWTSTNLVSTGIASGSSFTNSGFIYSNNGNASLVLSGGLYYLDLNVVIPSSIDGIPVTGIGNNAFRNYSNITSVVIPDNISNIGSFSFAYCTSLTNVIIGNGVTNISDDAFQQCGNIASVTLGNSVATIGHAAFAFSSNLTSIYIPASVTRINAPAFCSCPNLTNATFAGANCTLDKPPSDPFGPMFAADAAGFSVSAPAGGTVQSFCTTCGYTFHAQ
jgi:hypothetical protein